MYYVRFIKKYYSMFLKSSLFSWTKIVSQKHFQKIPTSEILSDKGMHYASSNCHAKSIELGQQESDRTGQPVLFVSILKHSKRCALIFRGNGPIKSYWSEMWIFLQGNNPVLKLHLRHYRNSDKKKKKKTRHVTSVMHRVDFSDKRKFSP